MTSQLIIRTNADYSREHDVFWGVVNEEKLEIPLPEPELIGCIYQVYQGAEVEGHFYWSAGLLEWLGLECEHGPQFNEIEDAELSLHNITGLEVVREC